MFFFNIILKVLVCYHIVLSSSNFYPIFFIQSSIILTHKWQSHETFMSTGHTDRPSQGSKYIESQHSLSKEYTMPLWAS
jgi:hypothetical protein